MYCEFLLFIHTIVAQIFLFSQSFFLISNRVSLIATWLYKLIYHCEITNDREVLFSSLSVWSVLPFVGFPKQYSVSNIFSGKFIKFPRWLHETPVYDVDSCTCKSVISLWSLPTSYGNRRLQSDTCSCNCNHFYVTSNKFYPSYF